MNEIGAETCADYTNTHKCDKANKHFRAHKRVFSQMHMQTLMRWCTLLLEQKSAYCLCSAKYHIFMYERETRKKTISRCLDAQILQL
jgi:hypothetical protein